uniref:Digestive cysteine proteinase 3-like isoform X2 n=1 Tax=Dermatophagoides pteronyssinus TaxID=6956 RepID=A0A6P6XUW1_DERPT|nr:digestive cysteine proteinase 3-like isoform X2 [Dermatophagoides pteronyssinus]
MKLLVTNFILFYLAIIDYGHCDLFQLPGVKHITPDIVKKLPSLPSKIVSNNPLSKLKKLSPLCEKIMNFIETNQREVDSLLKRVGMQPDQMFSSLYPNMSHFKIDQLKSCYNMRMSDDETDDNDGAQEEHNIFENTFLTTVKSFYKHFSDDRFESKPFPERIKNLFDSMHRIAKHTMACVLKPAGFQLGFTQLSDWSDEDFNKMQGERISEENDNEDQHNKITNRDETLASPDERNKNLVRQKNDRNRSKRAVEVPKKCLVKNRDKLPAKLDWRELNAVTPVKFQGECGSCWAFTSIANIESAYLIHNKTGERHFDLSEQEILACAKPNGCKGGTGADAYKYMIRREGIARETTLPYKAKDNECPKQERLGKAAAIEDYCMRGKYVKLNGRQEVLNDEEIMFIVREYGPIYTTIHIDDATMKHYKTGVYDNDNCSKQTNHAVTIVGWDEESWIIKNSWGKNWGDKGFFRVKRGKNLCGINTYVMYAIV